VTQFKNVNRVVAVITLLYAAALVALALHTPLRLDETLQFAAVKDHSIGELLVAVAASPGAAPLHYLMQAPFVAWISNVRLSARLLSILWAAASLPLFWQVCRKVRAPRAILVLCLFALLPSHLYFAMAGRPFEQALFFLLVALLFFFKVAEAPAMRVTVLYSAALLLTIYTEPFAMLPAVGCLLFFLRGAADRANRRAFWHLLPATAIPAALYLPYAIWAVPQTYGTWLTSAPPAGSPLEQMLQSLTGAGRVAEGLSVLLIVAALAVAWRGIRQVEELASFCCFGALVITLAVVLPLDTEQHSPIWPGHLVFLAPVLALLGTFAAAQIRVSLLASAAVVLPLAIASVQDVRQMVLEKPLFDPEAEAHAVRAELSPDACLVFVSEGVSRWLYLPFEPSLDDHECKDFFSKKIVLAVHPFVRPEQFSDARSFFRGLNLQQASEDHAGGGRVIVLRPPE
jgi:type IV secretory pathway VirB2 component (pilin)